jgi:hypothetical protein
LESHESGWIAATLANRAGADATPAQIADAMVAIWQDIDATLIPIIGHRGAVALYDRSRYLTGATHPWLAGKQEGLPAAIDLASLRSSVAQQSATAATAGATALLLTFHQLLATLVGRSLTERLLRPVWANTSSGRTSQDLSP